MKRGSGTGHAALALAALLAVVAGALLASLVPGGVTLELGRERRLELEPRLEKALAAIEGEFVLAWFGSSPSSMPSEWRDVPATVREFMELVDRSSAGRARLATFAPADDPEAARYAARVGARPHAVRTAVDEGWTETQVWSALRIVDGARGAAIVPFVTPGLAPRLQELVAAELESLRAPRRPRVAITAPEDFLALRTRLGERCDVREVDFERAPELADGVDLFVWIEPRVATAEHARELETFLARGGSAWIAGAERADGEARDALLELLPRFGLAAAPGTVLDERGGELASRVASVGEHQDFRALAAEPGGTLFFRSPAALEPLAERLDELGCSFRALACSDASSLLARDLSTEPPVRLRSGAQVLGALVEAADPWRGALVVLGSSSPLRDTELADDAAAHRGLVDALQAELASPPRLARRSVARDAPLPPPETDALSRVLARVCLSIAPALLVLAIAFRSTWGAGRAARILWIALPATLAIASVLVVGFVPRSAALDLTREGEHALPRAFERLVRGADGPVRFTAVVAPDEELPPELRGPMRAVRARLVDIAALDERVEHSDLRPATSAEVELGPLELGAGPPPRARSASRLDERTELRSFRASIYVASATRAERIDLLSARDAEAFDARLALVLERVLGGPRRIVAFAAGEERLSPAEARLEYERRGRFAPRPGARFELARAALVRRGFSVVDVDPERPVLPADCASLVVLGPRRDARLLGIELARHLERGGAAVLAMQPLRLRPTRRVEDPGELALWPEPQFPDLDERWLPRLGVVLPRTIVADARSGAIALDVKLERPDTRAVFAREEIEAACIVRTAPAESAFEALAARALPELRLALPAHIELDRVELARRGLVVTPLYATSASAWETPWTGGDVAEFALDPDAIDPSRRALPRAPLAVLVRGGFPGPEAEPEWKVEGARAADGGEGALVLVASAECLANDALAEDPAAEEFLAQAVAATILPRDLAECGARRALPAGLEPISAEVRRTARIALAFGIPLVLLSVGFATLAHRRRLRVRFQGAQT